MVGRDGIEPSSSCYEHGTFSNKLTACRVIGGSSWQPRQEIEPGMFESKSNVLPVTPHGYRNLSTN
jgi:hypothetical protein